MENASPEGMNREQLERLYRETESAVYNVLYRWVWNRADAAELTQEAFLRMWRMREKVSMETVKPLLFRIALNLAKSQRRRQRLWRWVNLEDLPFQAVDHTSPDKVLAQQQCESCVRACISRLPEKLCQILLLCEFSDMHYGDIALALNISSGTVGSRRHRAMAKLKLLLEECGYALEDPAP